MSLEYDIWPWPPDLTVTPTEGRSINPDLTNGAPAPSFLSFPALRSERIFKLGFAWDIQRDMHLAKAFWHDHGGRHSVFLVPSWNRDFTVASLPASGSSTLAVNVANYGAARLTTTQLDEIGRYVFCYDLAGGLHVAKVLSSADDTISTLTLEQAFPFAPTREALFGFALLCRFDEDESNWQHQSPTHAKVSLVFRTVRESIRKGTSGALVEGVEVYESLPFTDHVETVETVPLRRDVSYCYGPKNYHVTQNALYTSLWACWPSTTGGFRILRDAIADSITPPDESQGFKSGLTSALISTAHVCLAFDQVGYEVIAWQDGDNAKIIRYQNGTPTTTTFEGWSPVLFFNGLVNIQAKIDGTTDVVCYYIRRSSGVICARFQRDGFATEYVIGGYPQMPLLLFKMEAAGLVQSLTAMDDGYRKMVLSTTYPAQPDPPPDPYVYFALQEAAGALCSLIDAAYENGIISGELFEAAGAVASISDVLDEYAAPPPTNFSESFGAIPSLTNIAYDLIVFGPPTLTQAAGGSATVADIIHILAAIETAPIQEAAAATPTINNIYYGP